MAGTSVANHELVSFGRPPVEEIAFAVQLVEPVLSLEDIVASGASLRGTFPVRQLQPPLPRMLQTAAVPSFSISATIGVPLPRFWFVSEDGLQLVQVQEDRIAFNWRRLGSDAEYPRYWRLRERFETALEAIAGAAPAMDLKAMQVDFCELTYVNELEPPGPHEGRLPLEAVLTTVHDVDEPDFLPPPDDAQWTGQWTIVDDGCPLGRLTATAQPALRQRDQRPIYLLTMTAALPGEITGIDAMRSQFDIAHEWIVRGFADLTTKDMHDIWNRTK